MKQLTKTQSKIVALRDSAISGYNKVVGQFTELEKGYMAFIDEAQQDSLRKREKSAIPTQIIRAKVRKIERDIMKTYFSNDTLAQIEIDGDPKLTAIMQKKINNNASKKMNLYTIIRPNVRDALVYGTTVAKVYWSNIKNKLVIQPRNLNEICIDPSARNHFDAKFFVDRFYMTIDDIKTQYKGKSRGIKFDELSSMGSNGDTKDQAVGDIGEYRRIEVVEVYRFTGDKWTVSTMVGDVFLRTDVVLSDGNPFIFGILAPQFVGLKENHAVRSYGDSYIAPMIPLQTQYIATRNQQFDAIDAQLNPRFLTTRNSGLKDEDLRGTKKKLIVNNLENIRELPVPNINQSIFDTNKIDEEIQEVGGLPKFAQGMTGDNDPSSATGANLITESGNATVDDIITSFNESFFQPLVSRVVMLTYKYEESLDFVGFDRKKEIAMSVTINAGVGAMNAEMRSNNIDNAILSLTNTVKLFLDAEIMEKAQAYIELIDELTIEKAKLLGVKNIEEKIKSAKSNPIPQPIQPTGE